MIAVAFVFLFPTLGRIWPIYFGIHCNLSQDIQYLIIYFVLLALIFYDKQANREFKPYLVALPLFAMHQLVFQIMYLSD